MGAINLGGGHCCVCTGICHHVGPARYCAEHAPDRSSTRAVPAAHGGDAP